MTKREFREKVDRAAPTLSRKARDFAIDYQADIVGNIDSMDHVRNCVLLAGSYETSRPKEKDATVAILLSSVVESAQLVERITPWVEDIRRQVFDDSTPPFENIKQAEKWLRDESTAQYRGEDATGLLELGKTLVRAWPGGTLVTLAKQQEEIEKWTGFSERAALAFILCGIEPLRPRYRVTPERIFGKGKPARYKVMIEVNEVLNRDDLAAIQKRVRAFLHKKSGLHSPREWIVLQAVAELGGEPATGKMDFWEKVAQECNRQRPGTYKNREGPRKLYRRMQGKKS